MILGWFLLQAATAEASSAMLQETFRGKRVRDVMTPDPEGIEPAWSIERFVEEAGRPNGHSTYPVVEAGRLVGLMSLRLAGNVPPEERSHRTVGQAMLPRSEVPTVRSDAPAVDALEALRGPSGRAVVVDEDDSVAGILSSADVARALEIERLRAAPAAAPARRTGLLVWVVVGLIMASAAGYLYHPPLAVLSPAPAVDVVGDIRISGVPVDVVNGRYLMVPVRVSRPNALGALVAAFDPSRDVVSLSAVLPVGSDPERIGREQRALYRESQMLAATAAAQVLGLPVSLDGSGARVVDVVGGSPAAGALEPGDVIVAVDETPVRLATDLRDLISARPAGTSFVLSIERGDLRQQVRVSSAALQGGTAALGVVVETRGLEVDLPFEVEFRERPVGGPSAGLAYALAIVDLLDPDDLAGGRTIAATGTVDANGNVGPVAGLSGKAASAREAGAEILLVASQNVEDARTEDLEVIGSASLAEALAALRSAG